MMMTGKIWFSSGADKSLARPGRKQANFSLRMEWISFGALPCRKRNLMTARVSILLKSRASLTCLFPSWSGYGLISTPGKKVVLRQHFVQQPAPHPPLPQYFMPWKWICVSVWTLKSISYGKKTSLFRRMLSNLMSSSSSTKISFVTIYVTIMGDDVIHNTQLHKQLWIKKIAQLIRFHKDHPPLFVTDNNINSKMKAIVFTHQQFT